MDVRPSLCDKHGGSDQGSSKKWVATKKKILDDEAKAKSKSVNVTYSEL